MQDINGEETNTGLLFSIRLDSVYDDTRTNLTWRLEGEAIIAGKAAAFALILAQGEYRPHSKEVASII